MTFPLSFTLAQLNPTVGDLRGNCDKVIKTWQEHDKSDLVIFPEMIVTGYPTDDLVLKPYFMDWVEQHVEKIIQQSKTQHAAILLPTPWRQNGALYNAAHLIHDGKILHTTYKHHLPNYGVFDEKRLFTAGEKTDIIEFKSCKLGIMICEDMWFADVAHTLKEKGADILIVANGSPYQQNIAKDRILISQARVRESDLPLLYVNQVGGQDELVFDGRSFVMDKNGKITHQMNAFEEDTLTLETAQKPTTNTHPEEQNSLIYNALKTGLRDYVVKNNFSGILLGLSGGIDSALSAVLAVDAVGADKVHCVMMPSAYTSADSLEDAKTLAQNLQVKYDIIPIEDTVKSYNQTLEPYISAKNTGTTFENLQSRTRGVILMALSNAGGKMLLTTGNKSEMAVGYATLYGDMCGGFNALKDIYKTQVFALCRWRNAQEQKQAPQNTPPLIPERIITKPPSAELKPDQTDQDTLPPYDVLDDILHHLIEQETPITHIPHDKNTVLQIWRMLDMAEYKRFQSPPGVKITKTAFGRNRRYPITNGFFKTADH